MRIGVIANLLSGLAVHLERFQARRAGKRAGRSFMREMERSPWLQRRFRTSIMRIGPPALKGKRLARTQKSCCPANLLVQPKGRKYEDGLCNCGQHIHVVQPVYVGLDLASKEDISLPRPLLISREILTDAGYIPV